MAKKRPKRLEDRMYYIRRTSELDDSRFFCAPDSARVFFEKATWCAAILSSFLPGQKARVVLAKRDPKDVSFQEWIVPLLEGTGVTVEEYLRAIETNVREQRRKGPGLQGGRRAARALL